MARNIQFPCDYRNDVNLRKEQRRGNWFLLILMSTCAAMLLLTIALGVVLGGRALTRAIRDGSDALKDFIEDGPEFYYSFEIDEDGVRYSYGTEDLEDDVLDRVSPEPPNDDDPAMPQGTPETEGSQPTEQPTPEASFVPDVSFRDHMAQPFVEDFEALPDIVEAVSPAVVGVINYQTYDGFLGKSLEEFGSGSGFLITTDGYVVTNQHVIDEAEKIGVILFDGTEYDADLIGYDINTDVAVLKIDESELAALPIGDSDAVRVGEYVLAIGNPLDSTELYGSVTFGIISAVSRSMNIEGFTNDYLQTDAAINPGNSGGPLIDMNGRVIGMNSAKSISAGYDESGNIIASEGIGFALPINDVMEIVERIILKGKIQRPGIGVTVSTRDAELAAHDGTVPGVFIYSVTEGGPADQAGLQPNDIILAIDDLTVKDQESMIAYVQKLKVGDVAVFRILRGDDVLELSVTVGDMNAMP